MKTNLLIVLSALSSLAGMGCASSRTGEEGERAAFVTLLGADTLAVEQFRRSATGMEADVVLRTPRTTVGHYELDLDERGLLRRYEATVREPGTDEDARPLRQEVVVPEGDSLRVTVTEDGETEVRVLAGGTAALPFIDMVHWPFELMLRRAYAMSVDTVRQPLFTDRNTLAFRIGRPGGDSLSVTHPFRGTMYARVDEEGRLLSLDAGATTRKLTVTRVPEVDLERLARSFAARDAAGQSFGALSGRGEAVAQVNGATIRVDYGRPAKRGREIFGALVPWGQLWRTGANQATHFETDRALVLGGLQVPAGRYTLYTIPEPDGGTLIVNRQTGQGGTTYDQDRDLGRVRMTASALTTPVEWFIIGVEETAGGGELQLQWDRTQFAVPFTVVP